MVFQILRVIRSVAHSFFVGLIGLSALRVGVSSGVITPPVGVPMAGFGARTEVSQGVHDDLHAKILLMESGGRRAALVTLDLVGLGRDEMNRLREAVGKHAGTQPTNVMIGCSHTHSGPSVKPNPMGSLPLKEQQRLIDDWLRGLRSKLSEIADEASENLTEAKVKFGKGLVTGLSYNRRKPVPEGACMLIMETGRMKGAVREQYKAWGMPPELIEERAVPGIPTGPIDPELIVLRFEALDGKPIAIVVNFSCHPVTLGPSNLLISADYPGYLRRLVEESEGATLLFTQGASGNVRPYYSERSFQEAERIGTALASITLKTMRDLTPLPPDIEVQVANSVFELPLREVPPPEEAERLINKREEELKKAIEARDFREVRRLKEELLMLRRISGQPTDLPVQWLGVTSKKTVKQVSQSIYEKDRVCELQVLALGDVIFAAVPGELFTELGLEIKRRSWSKRVMVVTLANGSVGYIPTKEAYEEGGYETKSLLKPGVGELIVDRMVMLIDKLEG